MLCLTVDSCNYKLEKDDLCVSELFEMLDSVKVEIGILDWGIKMTTLEDGKWELYVAGACCRRVNLVLISPLSVSLSLQCFWTLSSTVEIKEQRYLLPFVLGGCHANSAALEENNWMNKQVMLNFNFLVSWWLIGYLFYTIIVITVCLNNNYWT